jgi:hypothetical protein
VFVGAAVEVFAMRGLAGRSQDRFERRQPFGALKGRDMPGDRQCTPRPGLGATLPSSCMKRKLARRALPEGLGSEVQFDCACEQIVPSRFSGFVSAGGA